MIIVQIQPLNLLKLTGIIFINTTVGYRQKRGQCEKAVEVYLGQNFDCANFLIAIMKFSMMFVTYFRKIKILTFKYPKCFGKSPLLHSIMLTSKFLQKI